MEQRLFDAARTGNVSVLHELLKEDSLILEKVCPSHFAETPLHVATLAAKPDFVKEVIRLMPSFAMELNRDGFSAMHMASARGHIDIVKELLKLDTNSRNHQCLLKDKDGQIPLHYAVIRGRIPVIEELISHCPQSLQEIAALSGTVLHLAVKNSQFGALKVVVERIKRLECFETLLSTRDNQGQTIAELAEATKQVQVLQLLKEYHVAAAENAQIDNNVSTKSPGNKVHIIHVSPDPETDDNQHKEHHETTKGKTKPSEIEMHNLMLVAAVLIATVTYQAGLSPPPTIWKEGANLSLECMFNIPYFTLKGSTQQCPGRRFYGFMILNTAGFFSSAAVIIWVTLSYRWRAVKPLGTSIWMLLFSYIGLLSSLSPDSLSSLIVFLSPPFVIVVFYCSDHLIRYILRVMNARIKEAANAKLDL